MTNTGTEIIQAALRDIGVLDAVETANAEQVADGALFGTLLIDRWRTKRILIAGITISSYSLVSGTQSYTIGSGGTFNQTWPTAIEFWNVVPDDDAADPLELRKGRPLTYDQWAAIRVKSQTGPRPSVMYYDRTYAAGLGNCLFHPIPDNNDVDVKLYTAVPAITSLVAATSYDLRPGVMDALIRHLGIRLARHYGRPVDQDLKNEAKEALGDVMKANIIPKESPARPEFLIGSAAGRRTHNIYQDG